MKIGLLIIPLGLAILAAGTAAVPAREAKHAPALEAKLLDGSSFALSGQTGKVVIVNFWASWCVPCRREMPALDEYYRNHRGQGLELIAISLDEPVDEPQVREIMRAFSFPAAMANQASFDGYGRIWRLPLTFVIDRDGRLRQEGWYGKPSIDLDLLEKTVTPLLTPSVGNESKDVVQTG